MKMLIVDDNPERYKELFASFAGCGLNRDDADMCYSSREALDRLEEKYYDLVLVDILIPHRPEDEPRTQNSIDILMAVHEGEGVRKPGHILGITGDLNICGEDAQQFNNYTWSVIEWSADSDLWIKKILNCLQYIQSKGSSSNVESQIGCDIAIVCALRDPEYVAVMKLPWEWSAPRPIDDNTFVSEAVVDVEGRSIRVACTSCSRMGMVSAALKSAHVIQALKPKLIVMTGICAGVKGKVDIGDVIVADPVWDFQSGKHTLEGESASFLSAPHQIPISHDLRESFSLMAGEHEVMQRLYNNYDGPSKLLSKVVVGPVACGSAVIADGSLVDVIQTQQHRGLLGVEMESYGVYSAANSASKPKPTFVAIKAVCDFADAEKNDNYQHYCAYLSAGVLKEFVEKFSSTIQWTD